MKLERSVLKAEIYGTEYTIRFPTYKQTQTYLESLKALGNEKDIDASSAMRAFLETLGLPSEVFDQLEVDHIMQIMDAITKKKQ